MTNSIDWTKAADLPPAELDRLLEEDHDEVDDNPPATDEQLAGMKRAKDFFTPEQMAGFPKRRPGERGPGKRTPKVQLTLRFDPDVIEAYRATGPGWQTRITEAVKMAAPKVA